MKRSEAMQPAKDKLPDYLHSLGVKDLTKNFNCVIPGHDDQKGSMRYYNNAKTKNGPVVHCYGCNFHGDIFNLYAKVNNIEYKGNEAEIFSQVYAYLGMTIENDTPGEDKPARKRPETNYTKYYKTCHAKISETDYPARRGLTDEIIDRFNIGYDPKFRTHTGETWQALIIPIDETHFTARNTDSEATANPNRYRKQGKGESIFNAADLEQDKDPVFITEGEIDALSIIQSGGRAVALRGKNTNALIKKLCTLKEQNKLTGPELLNRPIVIIIALDADKHAQRISERLRSALKTDCGVPVVYKCFGLPQGCKDPNEAMIKKPKLFKQRIKIWKDIAKDCTETTRGIEQTQRAQDYFNSIYEKEAEAAETDQKNH